MLPYALRLLTSLIRRFPGVRRADHVSKLELLPLKYVIIIGRAATCVVGHMLGLYPSSFPYVITVPLSIIFWVIPASALS
jgi:hypothetical protein